jgi:phage-related protein
MKRFSVDFLEQAQKFMENLDDKSRKKVLFNIWKSTELNDPELFKKLKGEIWEFRTKFLLKQIRLLAFWDKTGNTNKIVITTHGFIKKTQKTPKSEIEKAERIRKKYFDNLKKKKK